MKKIVALLVILVNFFLISVSCVYADTTIGENNLSKGFVEINFDGDVSKGIMIQTQHTSSGTKYQYPIKSKGITNIPLQMGDGEYTITVLEAVGTKYKKIAASTVKLNLTDPTTVFLPSIPHINYGASQDAVKNYGAKIKAESGTSKKVSVLYEDVVKNYKYDDARAANPPANYIPVIDEMYKRKMGICYDYSALMAGVLRSQGIPTKLVMGYAPEIDVYHAWNEIYIDGKWVVVDTTYDAAYAQAGQKYSMAKDASKFKPVKIY